MSQDQSPYTETTSLAVRAKEGDKRALADLYCRYLEAIRPFVIKKLRPDLRPRDHDIDDLIQNGFVVAIQALFAGKYDPSRGSFFSWLRTVIVRDIVDWTRKRPADRLEPEALAVSRPAGVATMLAAREEEAATVRAVREALTKLRDRYVSVLVVRDLLKLNGEACAAELGWGYRQGIDAYHRGRESLKRLLPGGLDDWQVFVDFVDRSFVLESQSQARARVLDEPPS